MRKNHIYMLLTVIAFVLILVSCSKTYQQPEEDELEVAQIKEKQKTMGILQSLCDIKENEDGSIEYQPRIGKVLYEITPTIYYTPAETLEEAEITYYHLLASLNESEDQQTKDKDVTQGDIHLTFEEGTSSAIASIKVDCPRLKNILTEIVFIPSTKWPENDMPSPFLFMSVWKQVSTGYIYVCVRKALGSKGIMLTFDGGWGKDYFKKYTHWQGEFYLWENTANTDAFEALTGAMNYNSKKFKEMLSKLHDYNYKNETYKAINNMYENKAKAYDYSYSYDHHVWWAYNCYDVTVRRIKVEYKNTYSTSTWNNSYTHKETPERKAPSHAFYFDPTFSKIGWECLFKGIS